MVVRSMVVRSRSSRAGSHRLSGASRLFLGGTRLFFGRSGRSLLGSSLGFGLWLAGIAGAADPPAITGLFPPGGQVGTEVEVAIAGKPGDGDLSVWSEQQQVAFTFSEKKETAQVKIPADAQPGIHWLRFFNQHGATDLRPFFVGTEPEMLDTEPNNEISEAQRIGLGTVNGTLHKSGEVDLFAVDLKEGETLTALVQANRELGSPMDGVLELLDPSGAVLVVNDDDHGNDPLATLTAARAGTYMIRLFAFPAAPNSSIHFHGAANYHYRLTVRTESEPAQPVVTNEPGELTIPWSWSGRISNPAEKDQFAFDGTKGQSVTISVAARAHHSLLDPIATLRTEAGTVVKEFDDISRDDPDVNFSVALPDDSRYVLEVTDRFGNGGSRYDYVVSVDPNRPSFSATVAQNAFVLAADKPLEVPVTITRLHGFDQRIAVSAEGLPEGVTAAISHSEKEGDTAKTVTLKIEQSEGAAPFSGIVRIVGSVADDQPPSPATAAKPGSKERTDKLWLTVVK